MATVKKRLIKEGEKREKGTAPPAITKFDSKPHKAILHEPGTAKKRVEKSYQEIKSTQKYIDRTEKKKASKKK